MLKSFIGIDYDIVAITLDPYFFGQPTDYSAVTAHCERLGVVHIVKETHIGEIVFDARKEKHPCSLCARMRRGALHDEALKQGCNKIALGHHFDDAVETFMMNLFHEGRLGCFSPKSYLSRKKLTLIRPMVFAPEKDVRQAALRNGFPIVKSKCPADGETARQKMKEYLAEMERNDHGFKDRMFGALRRSGINGWGFPEKEAKAHDDRESLA